MSPEFVINHLPSSNIRCVLSRIYFCVTSVSHHPGSQRSAVLFSRLGEPLLALYQNSHIVKLLSIAPWCFPKIIHFLHQKSRKCN